MTSKLLKNTLVAIALGSIGLIATSAQADGNRNGYESDHRVQDSRTMQNRHANPHSRMLIQRVNVRQNQQMHRIKAGMRNGSLTRNEYRELMQQQRRIRGMEQRFRADGSIDNREFKRLDRALDRASHNIRDEKHDRQARTVYDHGHRFN
jgi:hypothetical protein